MMAKSVLKLVHLFVFHLIINTAWAVEILLSPVPQIIPNISETVLNTGDNYTIVCNGNNTLSWTVPEVPEPYSTWTEIAISATNSTDGPYKFSSTLNIINATFPFTGYYICNYSTLPKEVSMETSTYIYVRDEDHLAASTSDFISLLPIQYSTITIPCRPTDPNISVTLINLSGEKVEYDVYDPKVGFSYQVNTYDRGGYLTCRYTYNSLIVDASVHIYVIKRVHSLPRPQLFEMSKGHVVAGDQLILMCSIELPHRHYITLNWRTPNEESQALRKEMAKPFTNSSQPNTVIGKLIINNTNIDDSGIYWCTVNDNQNNTNSESINVTVFEAHSGFINLNPIGSNTLTVQNDKDYIKWIVHIDAHPIPNITWFDNQKRLIPIGRSYKYNTVTSYNNESPMTMLQIMQIQLSDYGVYTLVASNPYVRKELKLFLNVTQEPKVYMEKNLFKMPYNDRIVKCFAEGNPLPQIEWLITSCWMSNCSYHILNATHYKNHTENFQITSHLNLTVNHSGFLKCRSWNSLGVKEAIEAFVVTDIKDGFDLYGFPTTAYYIQKEQKILIARGDIFNVSCAVSLYKYESSIEWLHNGRKIFNDSNHQIQRNNESSNSTYILNFLIEVDNSDNGLYSCRVKTKDGKTDFKNVTLEIADPQLPFIRSSNLMDSISVNFPEYVELYCKIGGLPKPNINWYKDKMLLEVDDRIQLIDERQKLVFTYTTLKDEGSYECEAYNNMGNTSKLTTLTFFNKPPNYSHWYILVIIVLFIVICMASIHIIIKCRAERRLQSELKKIGLENFERGAVENLNPDLGITDQADLLPYNRKWEFPVECLILGKQLGSGAFGVVMKAEAKGILKPGETTIVAVKMVKKNADNTFIKALASELKIMIHLGQHLNVVNLLGACTKNVAKRELLVIVEYCRYGNILHYLLRHRRNFIDQIDTKSGRVDYSVGSNTQNPNEMGENVSVPATPIDSSMSTIKLLQQDKMTDSDGVLISNNSVDPQWNMNYKGDYKGEIVPHICTKDLLTWSFQVARGMDYLASRKVLHGDLAARNILLAENNVVKICDFGLARNMYQTDNYKKKGNGPLPVKWMAIESIRDGVFSSQSDVWSFGIVLWELFTLGQTPYTGMEANERLYNKLIDGYRMLTPKYAPKDVYKIMLDCWQPKPASRPSFTLLSERIGSILEDSVTRHYIDLNDPYLVMNTEALKDGESDYLAMLSSPNYENFSTMENTNTIGNPNEKNAEIMHSSTFLFDGMDNSNVKKANERLDNADGKQIELVPMLPLYNKIDDSDCDSGCNSPTSNSISNPSYHMPPILTEKSEFDNILNISTNNYVNLAQPKHETKQNEHDEKDEEIKDSHYTNSCTRDWEIIKI